MSGSYKTIGGPFVVVLVLVSAVTAQAAVKPRDPNSAKTRVQKASTTQPQKVIPKSVVAPAKDQPAQALQASQAVQTGQPALENPARFTPDMTFGRAIEILRHCTNPPVSIVVLWRDVEGNAGITQETPIGLDGVPGLRVRQYIELLLRSVSAGSNGELGYVIDGGAVVIATKDSLPKPKLETRVYDISDLASPPSMGMMGMPMMSMMSPYGGYGMGMGTGMPYGGYGTGMPSGGYGGYGTGMPYNGYNPGTAYNPGIGYNSQSRLPGYNSSTQRGPSNMMMLVR